MVMDTLATSLLLTPHTRQIIEDMSLKRFMGEESIEMCHVSISIANDKKYIVSHIGFGGAECIKKRENSYMLSHTSHISLMNLFSNLNFVLF